MEKTVILTLGLGQIDKGSLFDEIAGFYVTVLNSVFKLGFPWLLLVNVSSL